MLASEKEKRSDTEGKKKKIGSTTGEENQERWGEEREVKERKKGVHVTAVKERKNREERKKREWWRGHKEQARNRETQRKGRAKENRGKGGEKRKKG